MTTNTFNTSFKKYYPRLVTYAYSLLENAQASEDIVQDAFEKLLKRPDEDFTHLTGIRLWLYSTVRNGCLNYKRRDKRTSEIFETVSLETATKSEVSSELKEWIGAISADRCREILQLLIEGYTTKEIAQMFSISRNTVQNQRTRGVYLIKKFLKRVSIF